MRTIHRKQRLFYIIFLASLVFSAAYLALRRGAGLEVFIYDQGRNLIGDFTNNLHYPTHAGGPYYDSMWAAFPPLAYTFYYLFNVAFTRANFAFEMLAYTMITSFTCILMLYAVQELFRQYRKESFSSVEPFLLTACATLSGAMIYCVERGNSVFNVMVMLLWALALRDSKEGWKREAALVLIAVAANFKLYPAAFGVLYLLEKRWREAVRLIVYGVVLFVVPFAWFGGWDGFLHFMDNQSQIHAQMRDDYLTSIPSAAAFLAGERGSDIPSAFGAGKIIAFAAAVPMLVGVVLDKRLWIRCLLLCSIFILVPGWSAEYMAVYMLLPLVLCYCTGEKERWFGMYMALFAGIFILLPFGVTFPVHTHLSWNTVVSFGCIYLITALGCVDAIGGWITRKKA